MSAMPRYGGERSLAAACGEVELLDPLRLQRRVGHDGFGLVGGVRLVEVRGPRDLGVLEQADVSGGRRDDVGAAPALAEAVVGGEVVERHEQRALALRRLLDGVDGEFVDDGRVVVAGAIALAYALAVVGDVVVVVAGLEGCVPVVDPGRRFELVARVVVVSLQVLADPRRPVAGVVHPHGQGVELVLQVAVAGGVGEDAVVVRVVARHVLGTRGAAERRGDDVVAEVRALVLEQLERLRHVLGLEVVDVLVIGVDEDHVRLARGVLRGYALGARLTLVAVAAVVVAAVAGAPAGAERSGDEARAGEQDQQVPSHSAVEGTHPRLRRT